ncbi:carph-isopro domain-containing protein [Rhodovulum sp. DZ06]|uniref:carph-isopro domain-containing protein n=1 Tax=Rhodovulum sp. DZ06 TaxID=3425126 RepID=UPI003D335459
MDAIFDLWPSMAALARDIGEREGTVRAWKRRGSIPAPRHAAVVDAARARGIDLTFEGLARACAGSREGETLPADLPLPAPSAPGAAEDRKHSRRAMP